MADKPDKKDEKKASFSETNPEQKFDDKNTLESYFFKQYDRFSKLQQANQEIHTWKGLKDGSTLDPTLASHVFEKGFPRNSEDANQFLEDRLKAEQTQLLELTSKNSGGLVSLLDKEFATMLAPQFPAFTIKGKKLGDAEAEKKRTEDEKKYNTAVAIVNKSKEVLKEISRSENDNGKQYALSLIKKLNIDPKSMMANYIIRNGRTYMGSDSKNAIERAQRAIKQVGVLDYLKTNLKRMTEVKVKSKEQEKDEEKLAELRITYETGETPKARELAWKPYEESMKKYEEKYANQISADREYAKVLLTIQDVAYKSILAKKEAEKAKSKTIQFPTKQEKKQAA